MLVKYLILITIPLIVQSSDKHCDPLLAKADVAFQKVLFVGDHRLKPITDQKKLTAHCSELSSAKPVLQKWGKCLSAGNALIFEYFFNGVKTVIVNRCSSDVEKKKFLDANKCLNRKNIPKINGCIDRVVYIMQRYARKKETGQDIRRDSNAMCCFLSYVIDCIKNVAQETCGDQGSSVASYIHKTAMDLMGEFGQNMCKKMGEFDVCRKNSPDIVKEIDQIVKSRRIPHARTSPLVPFVHLFRKVMNPVAAGQLPAMAEAEEGAEDGAADADADVDALRIRTTRKANLVKRATRRTTRKRPALVKRAARRTTRKRPALVKRAVRTTRKLAGRRTRRTTRRPRPKAAEEESEEE